MRYVRFGRRHRLLVLGLADAAAWVFAVAIACSLRLDTLHFAGTVYFADAGNRIPLGGVLALGALAGVLHLVFGLVVRLHQGRAPMGSFEEMLLLGGTVASVGLVVTIANLALTTPVVPRSVPVVAMVIALMTGSWMRAMYRRTQERLLAGAKADKVQRVLIVGAGDGGRQLVQSMKRDPSSTWMPVGFLDDDKQKRHLRVRGVPVLGKVMKLAEIAESTEATSVVIAVPSAGSDFILRVSRLARAEHLDVKVLPGINELADRVGISDLRDIDMTDVLGRRQIDTDVDSIADYLRGKRVLVTGAGGSIGSELCRQIRNFGPAELMMLDRDESALHALQLSLHGTANLDSSEVLLADIRDGAHLRALFAERRPEVVFHAAALKHLNILERFPGEAIKTNVWGSLAVLEAAEAAGVGKFVNVSTDKAADPCNVLGYTKRLAEGLTAEVAARAAGVFISVRFGNVLGSRGSVLTTFAAQIAAGGPVTVTHPEVTRYFMTIQEAVQLVIQAGAIGANGEALVLDMGEPIAISEVAQQLIEQSDRPVEVVYTGLKPGEKMHEDLIGASEPDVRPVHPLVSHVPVRPVSRVAALDLAIVGDISKMIAALQHTCDAMVVGGRGDRLGRVDDNGQLSGLGR